MVTLTNKEFQLLYDTLKRVNEPYTHEEAGDIVEMERQAWNVIAGVAEREGVYMADPSALPPSSGESPSS